MPGNPQLEGARLRALIERCKQSLLYVTSKTLEFRRSREGTSVSEEHVRSPGEAHGKGNILAIGSHEPPENHANPAWSYVFKDTLWLEKVTQARDWDGRKALPCLSGSGVEEVEQGITEGQYLVLLVNERGDTGVDCREQLSLSLIKHEPTELEFEVLLENGLTLNIYDAITWDENTQVSDISKLLRTTGSNLSTKVIYYGDSKAQELDARSIRGVESRHTLSVDVTEVYLMKACCTISEGDYERREVFWRSIWSVNWQTPIIPIYDGLEINGWRKADPLELSRAWKT